MIAKKEKSCLPPPPSPHPPPPQQKSTDKRAHLRNNQRRRPSLPVHLSGTGHNALSKEKKTTTGENKTTKRKKSNWKCSYDKWTLQWWSLEEMLWLAHTRKYFRSSGRDSRPDINRCWRSHLGQLTENLSSWPFRNITSDLWLHIK